MIKAVVHEYHWTPAYIIENLYLDDTDFLGLKFWFDHILDTIEQMKPKK